VDYNYTCRCTSVVENSTPLLERLDAAVARVCFVLFWLPSGCICDAPGSTIRPCATPSHPSVASTPHVAQQGGPPL